MTSDTPSPQPWNALRQKSPSWSFALGGSTRTFKPSTPNEHANSPVVAGGASYERLPLSHHLLKHTQQPDEYFGYLSHVPHKVEVALVRCHVNHARRLSSVPRIWRRDVRLWRFDDYIWKCSPPQYIPIHRSSTSHVDANARFEKGGNKTQMRECTLT